MKKISSFFVGLLVLASPAFTLAATNTDLNTLYARLLAQIAALTADQPVSCGILTSTQHVRAGEPFTFMWYSTGMHQQVKGPNGNAWAPSGAITMQLPKPGTWTYTLEFYGPGGAAPCSANIVVSQ